MTSMPAAPRVLVVEDDESISEAIAYHLSRSGLAPEVAGDGLAGLLALRRTPPDALVLDLMLPHMDGWYLIRQVRAQLPHLPIIVITGRTNEHDRLDVLALGADDVMAKPFSMRELVARVAASLRRAAALESGPKRETLIGGDLVLDLERLSATRAGEPLTLTPREFRLLEVLLSHAGRTMSRDEIYSLVWGGRRPHGDRSVDVLVRRLRVKIDTPGGRMQHVHTLHGVGYRLEPVDRTSENGHHDD